MVDGILVQAGRQAGFGHSGTPGDEAEAVPGHHGPHPQSSQEAAAPAAQEPRAHGMMSHPDSVLPGAHCTLMALPVCRIDMGADDNIGSMGPVRSQHCPHLPRQHLHFPSGLVFSLELE